MTTKSEKLAAKHKKANDELTAYAEATNKLADKLHAREEKRPGSVSKTEWQLLSNRRMKYRRMRDKMHKLAQDMIKAQGDEWEQERAERRKKIIDMTDQGMTAKEIAEALGISTTTVYKDRKK